MDVDAGVDQQTCAVSASERTICIGWMGLHLDSAGELGEGFGR